MECRPSGEKARLYGLLAPRGQRTTLPVPPQPTTLWFVSQGSRGGGRDGSCVPWRYPPKMWSLNTYPGLSPLQYLLIPHITLQFSINVAC